MYLSHYDKETSFQKQLKKHLEEVLENTEMILINKPMPNRYKTSLTWICKIAAITHDFGKYTSYFQSYLKTGKENKQKQHSFISALFGTFVLSKVRREREIVLPYAEIIIFEAILHHHGNLKSVSDEIVPKRIIINGDPHYLTEKIEILKQQIRDIQANRIDIQKDFQPVLSSIGLKVETIIEEFSSHWVDVIDSIYKQYYLLKRKAKKEVMKVENTYYYMLFIYSVLLNADKYSATNIQPLERLDIPSNLVDEYRKKTFDITVSEGMNGWRNKIYDSVMNKIIEEKNQLDHQHVYTLTAPTGSGKTLLSLSVALKWRNWIKDSKGYTPRIIYALPFTTIIDQNEKQIQKLLEQLDDFIKNRHRYLVKHHHLTTIEYTKENEELPLHQSLLLIENWESEIIVTTFIQLFNTLIGYTNRAIKKFHQITGSIVILDEIQNIPVEYWPLLRKVLKKMGELFSCKFILLTATQPLIFEKEETIELLENKEVKNSHFFQSIERVYLSHAVQPFERQYEVEEWTNMFLKTFEDGNNYLAIFNTIRTSIHVYNILKPVMERKNYQIFYLSTNIIPLERRRRIEKVKEALDKKKKILLISTQVVEAGVDLDFDIVYRDLGPIDAVIQAAGRCNRNGNLKKYSKVGEVRITPIKRNNQLECMMVYKGIHTYVAQKVLPKGEIQEHEFLNLIENYYSELKKYKMTDDSQNILEAMNLLRFSKKEKTNESLVSDFCLIPKDYKMVETYIEIDEEATRIWEKYLQEVIHEVEYKKRFEAYLNVKSELRKYIVSVPINLVENFQKDVTKGTKIFHIPYDKMEKFYDVETGIKRIPDWAL